MKKLTKERNLASKETVIKNLINSNDKFSVDAFNFIYNHYRLDYLIGKSYYFLVLKAIYIENVDLPKWKLAQYCNVSRTTLFEYRHEIIDCFYTCLKERITLGELAITKNKTK